MAALAACVVESPKPFSVLEAVEGHKRPFEAKELAEILGVSVKTLYKGAAAREIPSYRVLGALRFDPKAIGYWLRKQHSSFAAAGKAAL